jgi:hypothetical protein
MFLAFGSSAANYVQIGKTINAMDNKIVFEHRPVEADEVAKIWEKQTTRVGSSH